MQGEKYRPFVVSAIVGCILWSVSGGLIHAYFLCPDWEAMGQNAITALRGGQPLVALVCTGLVLGLAVEIAKFIGAIFRSEVAVLFLPALAGALIGALQGHLIASNTWGFAADTVFKDGNFRHLTGVACGAILSYPTVLFGMAVRRRGTPW